MNTSTGTDPNNPDSDDDTLSDGVEVNTHRTNPNNADSDGDGLNDNVELGAASPTDPTNPDSAMTTVCAMAQNTDE